MEKYIKNKFVERNNMTSTTELHLYDEKFAKKMEEQILNEMKKLNIRMDKLEELHRLIHDLLIEYITLKNIKIPNILNIESSQLQQINEEPEPVIIKKNKIRIVVQMTSTLKNSGPRSSSSSSGLLQPYVSLFLFDSIDERDVLDVV